jgi:hypothetical protein
MSNSLVATSGLNALVSSEVSNPVVGAAPAADTAQTQGDSQVREAAVVVFTLVAHEALSHCFYLTSIKLYLSFEFNQLKYSHQH